MIAKIVPRSQFLLAEKKTGIPLQKLIDHIYDEELKGNVKKLPATERSLFLKGFYNELPKEKCEEIINESKKVEEFKLERLTELRGLCSSENTESYIAEILGVPYNG
ncbi:hypothetical protein AWH48_11325 [Domibacillus aminovorans]|uniref:Uncharacterized protein n=1 Tax=Domibacillus aminovorans TaxID=29332 RepID=A0A177KLT1_9BACI|nr:hypothetical protein [Domibacillus aminovorans]OAH53855.1 hypothetical protein AWH48_11325 [Domibacillus aminovorans]